MSAFNPLWETVLQREIPRAALSRVTAYDWLVSTALSPVGQMLVGPVTAGVGIDATLWATSASFVVATAVALSVPGIRELRGDSGLRDREVAPEVQQDPVHGRDQG